MSSLPHRKTRYLTGVSLEPDVLVYLDHLSDQIGMSRSWALNTLIRKYARYAGESALPPLAGREPIIQL